MAEEEAVVVAVVAVEDLVVVAVAAVAVSEAVVAVLAAAVAEVDLVEEEDSEEVVVAAEAVSEAEAGIRKDTTCVTCSLLRHLIFLLMCIAFPLSDPIYLFTCLSDNAPFDACTLCFPFRSI